MSLTFLAKIDVGKLDFGSEFNEARWRQFLRDNHGKWVRIEKPKVIRTLSQNSLYWLYLEMVSRDTGNDENDLHDFFRAKFLPHKIVHIKGRKGAYEIERIQSTTELTKSEFGEYMEKICAYTSIPIPDVDEWKKANGYLPS